MYKIKIGILILCVSIQLDAYTKGRLKNMKKINFKWKYMYLVITIPIYVLYIIFVYLALGMGDDIWDKLAKTVKERTTQDD